tara:strand:- start:1623 stop:1928 length:306 start_codon:yes stop_codon:yes gene_type:complete
MKRIEIAMGRNIPNSGTVTDHMMNEFIKSDIMPLFEYGTFIDGEGFWKGEFEKTKIFYIELEDKEVLDAMPKFEAIAAAYKRAFRQEAVMISTVETHYAFK